MKQRLLIMKTPYDSSSFRKNFEAILSDRFEADASSASFVIVPQYDPNKSETGEDSAFRLILLSEKNIGERKLSFEDAVAILTAFEPHYPTKIEITKNSSAPSALFELKCCTRVRKPSAIADIASPYAPFTTAQKEEKRF